MGDISFIEVDDELMILRWNDDGFDDMSEDNGYGQIVREFARPLHSGTRTVAEVSRHEDALKLVSRRLIS